MHFPILSSDRIDQLRQLQPLKARTTCGGAIYLPRSLHHAFVQVRCDHSQRPPASSVSSCRCGSIHVRARPLTPQLVGLGPGSPSCPTVHPGPASPRAPHVSAGRRGDVPAPATAAWTRSMKGGDFRSQLGSDCGSPEILPGSSGAFLA